MTISLSHNNNRNSNLLKGIPVLLVVMIFQYSNLKSSEISDSLKKEFPEVKVYSTRIITNSLGEFSPLTILKKEDISSRASINLSEALVYVPGVFIKDYGGLGGMKTVSLRGSSSSQSLLMINGVRLNSSQNGSLDLSNLPISVIDNIEIIRSGFSAAFGGNAMGGCINIIPENPKYDKDAIAVSYGSFNEIFLSIYNARKMGDFSLGLSAEYKHSDGNYPININHFGENSVVNRTNAEFNNYSLTSNSQYQINKSIELNSFILLFNSQRGVPGAVLQGHIESLNSEYSESGALINIGNNIRLSDNIIFNTTYNLKVNQIHYRDKNLIGYGGKILDNKFNSLDNTLIFGLKNISQQSTFLFNTELFHSDLKGDMLQTDISSNPVRYGIALSQVYEYNDILSEKFKYNISLAFRTDIFNDNSPAYSPFLGLIIQPVNSDLSLKMNISRNFRMPSFNELYYLNYGTANLKPEKSNSINLGMAYNFGNINLELNSFLTHTEDLILAVPKSPVSWSAQNIGMASYKGIEVIAAYYMESNKLSANANYTLQFAEDISDKSINYQKQLVYVPYEMLNLNLSFELWDIQTAINLNYTGFRYSLQSNDISSVLDSYTTLNLKFSKEIKFDSKKLLISAQADNLTSENFEIVKNYPMPGRIFRLGVLFSTNSNPQM